MSFTSDATTRSIESALYLIERGGYGEPYDAVARAKRVRHPTDRGALIAKRKGDLVDDSHWPMPNGPKDRRARTQY